MSTITTDSNASYSSGQTVVSTLSGPENYIPKVNKEETEQLRNENSKKRTCDAPLTSSNIPVKKQNLASTRNLSSDVNRTQKSSSEVPACLERLVRTIVRMFYSREHSLIVDMLVRNTIMKENDLCERLRFEEKQLRQCLRTLKQDQFIKSKLQLETDASGKTTKITHYFIEYKLFVNVVKYRLDQVQRRLEAEQRKSTSRASFKCPTCAMSYTDLEVDRLLNPENPGKLMCVYCHAEVVEEKENVSRTDARALIAKFHHQVREPIDNMLRECDEVHLSSSILEPEIRPLEPLAEDLEKNYKPFETPTDISESGTLGNTRRNIPAFGPTESRVRIVLSGQADINSQNTKARPIWMADSTINSGPLAGLGELDRGSGSVQEPITSSDTTCLTGSSGEPITQTLAPGRVPIGSCGTFSSQSSATSADAQSSGSIVGTSATSGDIMQLLLVHERRRTATQGTGKSSRPIPKSLCSKNSTRPSDTDHSVVTNGSDSYERIDKPQYFVHLGDRMVSYSDITSPMIKRMTKQEREEYIRVGKALYTDVMMQ